MTISGRFFTYTPHTVESRIPETLENINQGFAGLLGEQRSGLRALLSGRLLVFGFKPVSQQLPLIQLTRGTVVTPEGTIVEYEPGELEYVPHAGGTNYIYLAANYTVDIATAVPEDARLVIASCNLNEDETDLVFDLEVLVETCTYNESGQLVTVEHLNGSKVLASQFYLYDEAGRVFLVVESRDGEFSVKEWAYNDQGLPARSGVSFVNGLSAVLGESLFVGIGETVVQGFD